MLRIENLSKRHGDHLVFQALTHTFSAGCTALCEQDSTGKSSLLDIIAGIVAPDSGDVWIDGHSLAHAPRQARARLAHVPGNCLANPAQTGRGLLEKVAAQQPAVPDGGPWHAAERRGGKECVSMG